MPCTSLPVDWSTFKTIETGAPGTTCRMVGTGFIPDPESFRSLKPPRERPPRPRPLFDGPRLERFVCRDEFMLDDSCGGCTASLLAKESNSRT
jgi:hypothetical protein